MNPIRPNALPPSLPESSAQDAAKMAAARAFFAAALGHGNAVAATATSEPATSAPPATRAAPAPSGDTPQKFLRPGSLLDIRV